MGSEASAVPPPDTISQIAAQPHPDNMSPNDIYGVICSQIIKEQGRIIGELSYEQASKVPGLKVDPTTYNCVVTGDGNQVIDRLVEKYREFFGNAAVEICREAASSYLAKLPNQQLPVSLIG